MASRKSSRVKKSPVIYQAPEPTHRAPRNVTPKQTPPRRTFSRDIELQMECVDDELSPAQLKAIKEAQREHEKANDLIKEVRAGNILVPSSQPNTFTIVPPKPSPTQPPPAAAIVQSSVMKSVSPPTEPTVPRGLPPPRPAQFLNKQLQEMNKPPAHSTSDVILISDTGTPQMSGITKVAVSQVSTTPMQMQQVTAVIPSQGVSATPQQMYKFVSVPSNMPTNVVQNQWALRPLLTVSPQQQQQQQQQQQPQLSFLSTTQFTPVRMVSLPQGTVPVSTPKSTGISASAAQLVKSTELVGKRSATSEPASAQPPAKKKSPKITEVPDQSGNWVPLDEYYYGTREGDVSYTEEKGEYRFKCWYCSKMLYNNIRAMQHIQGHIDASKQQNIDLSDLTQCKHCYKQFDTPFEMQTHVEKVHLSNKVLMCRICEKDFATPRELMSHMKGNHHACEMPYVCHLCNFRSSMYSDVVDHFKKKHDSSHFMLCLYCLRTFEVKFVSQGWGQTQTYYGHLLKHQSKSATKKCVVCRLTFFNTMDVKTHRKTCHVTSLQDMRALSQGGKSDIGHKQKNRSTLKSLNAPSISRIQDYGDITFPAETAKSKCIECKMMMSSTDHYKKYVHCTMCRFATSCSVAYANHMMGFHSGQMSSLNLNIPWERPMKDIMYCTCSFSSKYGNKVANHLVSCAKWTCSSTKQTPSSSTQGKTGDEEEEGSLLGVLGLVATNAVQTTAHGRELSTPVATDVGLTVTQTTAHGSKPSASAFVADEVSDSEEDSPNADMEWDTDDSRTDPDYLPKTDQNVSQSDKKEHVQDSDGENSDISKTWPALVRPSVVRATNQGDTKNKSTLVTSKTDIKGNEIVCDKNYPEIYVPKVRFSDTHNNKKKKRVRVQNSRHACLFCGKLKAHIQDHFLRKHRDKKEVQAIMNSNGEEQTEKKAMLRAEGDHVHNMKVIENKAGELILFRRPDQAFDHKDYGPCISCKEWLLKSSLMKHLDTCNGDTKSIVRKKRYLATMSDIAKGAKPEHAQDMLVREVFTIMTLDEVGLVVRQDELICQLGEIWLKTGMVSKKKRACLTSQHMRLMAKLLISLRNMHNDSGLTMWDVLKPSSFPSLVKAALEVSLPEMDDVEELKSPTSVIKMKHDLIRMVQIKSSKACQMYDKTRDIIWENGKKEAEDVLLAVNRWWETNCTKLARELLLEQRLTKKEQLPDPRDIQKLGEFLTRELRDAELDRKTVTYRHYSELMELTQARLLSYNKCRSGEIEDITLRHYNHKLDKVDLDEGLMGEISDIDKYLLKTHEIIQTKGKGGGTVLVSIPQECTPVMNFIADAEVREKLRISSTYLFCSTTDRKPVRAYDSLKTVCERSGVPRLPNITSTNLRKYMATLAQVMNLSADEMQKMCQHLGHTTRVHLAHDGTMSPFIERVTLGKILLMQDLNVQAQFSRQPLEDIDFIDIVRDTSAESTVEKQDDLMAGPSGSSTVDELIIEESGLME